MLIEQVKCLDDNEDMIHFIEIDEIKGVNLVFNY